MMQVIKLVVLACLFAVMGSAVWWQRGQLASAHEDLREAQAEVARLRDNGVELEDARVSLRTLEAELTASSERVEGSASAAKAAREAADEAVAQAAAAEQAAEEAEAERAEEARVEAERRAEEAAEAARRAVAFAEADRIVADGGSCDLGADGLPVCEEAPETTACRELDASGAWDSLGHDECARLIAEMEACYAELSNDPDWVQIDGSLFENRVTGEVTSCDV